jgi:hypothetical protein
MECSAIGARRQVWCERLQRFSESGLTVAAFCRQERVSVPSFYQWRRKLCNSAGAGTKRLAREARKNGGGRRAAAFVPVQITHSVCPGRVEIRLPNGVEVRLPAGDAALLSAGITAAGRLTTTGAEGEAC